MTAANPLMAGKKGLIMGVANERSIAWGIAQAASEHGAELAFTYQGDALGKRVRPLAEKVGSSMVLPCDVTDVASLDAVFDTIRHEWGRLEIVTWYVLAAMPNRCLERSRILPAPHLTETRS